MHPVIRVISFILFAILIARATLIQMGVAFVFLSGLLFIKPGLSFRQPLRMLWKLKWLLLSILIVYLLSHAEIARHEPWLAIQPALKQVMYIFLVLIAVSSLIATTSRDELIEAIIWLARPVRFLGVSPQRLAIRIALIMEYVPQLQQQLSQPQLLPQANSKLQLLANRLYAAFDLVVQAAEHHPCQQITLRSTGAPTSLQWLWVCLLVLMMYALSLI